MSAALAVLCLLATLGEGGGSPGGLASWHAALAALVVAALVASKRSPGGFPSRVPAAFGLFVVLVAVGAARASYAYTAWLQCFELGCWIAVGLLAASAGGPDRLLPTLARAALAGAAVQSLLAIARALAGSGGRPSGTFLNPNHMALWLVAAVLLGVGTLSGPPRAASRLALAIALPPALCGIALSGSRGALLGLLAGGLWLGAARWAATPRRWRVAAVAAGALLVAAAGFKLAERAREADPFRYQRLRIWKASLAAVAHEPLWGSGPGQFPTVAANLQFPDDDGPLRYDRRFSTTHSDWLRVPAELGLPAALALSVAVALAARGVLRRRRDGDLPATADGAIAALVAIGAHALVDNPSTWPSVYVLAAVLCGTLTAVRSGAKAPSPRIAARLALSAAVLAALAIGDLAPYRAWRKAGRLPRGGVGEEGYSRLLSAAALNRAHAGYPLRLAEHIAASGEPWTPEQYATAREWAERALRNDPQSAQPARALARVEARACLEWMRTRTCAEQVRALYERAEDRSQFDPAIPIELGKFLLDAGEAAAARRPAERALTLEPESVVPRLLLADVFLRLGSESGLDTARTLLDEATQKAETWHDWAGSPYGRSLLVAEAQVTSRLEAALASRGGS